MARKGKGFLIAIGLGVGVAILSRTAGAKAAIVSKLYKAPMPLTKNFDLSEFVKGLGNYSLNQDQFDNVSRLARLMQKGRDFLGVPVLITSGGRPTDWRAPKGYTVKGKDGKETDVTGKSLDEILKIQGYHPSPTTDHAWFGAADTSGFADPASYTRLAEFFAAQPDTRQVILEYKTVDGMPKPMAVHVAVVAPGKPKIKTDSYAFVRVDDKYSNKLVWQPLANV